MFGSSLVNGSSVRKGKNWPFDEHFKFLLEFANHVEAWDKLEDADTQKWLPTKWVPLRTILQDVPFFKKVEGLLAEVQADWEELKEMLCPIEAPKQLEGLFLLNDDRFLVGWASFMLNLPAILVKLCKFVKGIGIVVSPIEGRSAIDIKGI
ncbi:hypothetical protein K443DRAFT_9978 [Laccaria amethystina LaAM-08-1]|uniref:Uncharacterized protein n=1 Tax=Laccaria amethystina LaAM-08-1 TaxID=1095629 RepID=A0A0C9XI66_9AGAR|nr:hypothetical protein K443DRAFT_9978 [Laccaria amethystina LaAM-08-1]